VKSIKSHFTSQYTVLLYRLALLLFTATPAFAQSPLPLIPAPLQVTASAEGFTLENGDAIAVPDNSLISKNARWLVGLIRDHSGLSLEIVPLSEKAAAVRLNLPGEHVISARFEAAGLAPDSLDEAYHLVIRPDGVSLDAASEAGLFRGMTTLWQLLTADSKSAGKLPGVEIFDAPEFAWRGLMLDSARHMQSVEFIKRYIDWMALHKLNVLHWHLTDDQAWRLEIKAYPKLAQVGGFRVPAGAAPAADIDEKTGKPRVYGGYYSHEEVRDIVAHATLRHVTVVPEIDVPGHASAAIVAYPELGVPGYAPDGVPADWGIFHNVFNLEESTFEVLEAVLSEVVELFPSEFIHLGGDEVNTEQWQASERIRARMQELGIEDIQALQNYYVERLQAYLDQHQRRVIGWDEILESQLPAHASVMSWRGVEGAVEAAAKGHQTVLSPSPTMYLDHIQTNRADAPPGRGGIITARDIYEFNPFPDTLAENRELLLGVQANLWTEHIRTEERAAYMSYPRAAAVAELGWTVAPRRSWESFAFRLPVHSSRLKNLGIPAAEDDYALYRKGPEMPAPAEKNRREDRELELCSNAIVLALEDDAPLQGERESYLVDIMNPCWIWRDARLESVASVSASVGQLPFNFQIGDAIREVVVEKPSSAEGELRVRLGGCEGPVIAQLPLAPASGHPGATQLPPAFLSADEALPARGDLCFSFARQGIDPIWVIDWVRLDRVNP
jgi:hexosaminidase